MLHSRIAVIFQYLDGVKKGTQPADHETLRQIASLVASVTSSTSEARQPGPSGTVAAASFTDEFDKEQNDVLLTTLLGQMTKTLEQTNVLVDKFSLQQQRERDDQDAGFGSLRRGGGGGRRGIAGGAGGRGFL
jgi:COP9 signalosome complex subunit 6